MQQTNATKLHCTAQKDHVVAVLPNSVLPTADSSHRRHIGLRFYGAASRTAGRRWMSSGGETHTYAAYRKRLHHRPGRAQTMCLGLASVMGQRVAKHHTVLDGVRHPHSVECATPTVSCCHVDDRMAECLHPYEGRTDISHLLQPPRADHMGPVFLSSFQCRQTSASSWPKRAPTRLNTVIQPPGLMKMRWVRHREHQTGRQAHQNNP